MQPELRQSIEAELANAERARMDKNEGKARVCARRAAGLAARDFLTKRGAHLRKDSAYETLKTLASWPSLRMDLRTAAQHLTLQVTEEFTLPDNIDLIAEARHLIGGLG
jgi:hypothetical protein